MAFVERSSLVEAPAANVWTRIVTPEGINDEFRPWLTMSVPTQAADVSIDTLALGVPVGRLAPTPAAPPPLLAGPD